MKTSPRIYGLDALRATAMWLGVILHSIIFFKQVPEENWPHDPYLFSPALEWVYELIHSFRMPLFFLVAGYFSSIVISKNGLLPFIRQRFERILIPFVIGLIVVVPITLMPFHFQRLYYDEGNSLSTAISLTVTQARHWNGMAHLWFLYYLLVFYSITVVLEMIVKKISVDWNGVRERRPAPRAILVMPFITMIIIWGVLSYFNSTLPPVYTGIRISFFYLAYYGCFYFSGALIHRRSFNFTGLSSLSWLLLAIGLSISLILFYTGEKIVSSNVLYLFRATERISLIYGLIGLFVRYFDQPSYISTYFSASSYWVYLIHLTIIIYTQTFLHNVAINGWIKLVLIMTITFVLSIASFQLFVCNTIIGKTLNGKKMKFEENLLHALFIRKKKPKRPIPDKEIVYDNADDDAKANATHQK